MLASERLHLHLPNFPHHKHVGTQSNLQPSYQTSLEEVLDVVLG
jgi:hypothetical protein